MGSYPSYMKGDDSNAAPPPPATPSGFLPSVKRSIGGMIAGTSRAAQDVGLPWKPGEEYGEKLEQQNPSSITSLGDIVQHPFKFGEETAGEFAPQFAALAGGARVGGAIGSLIGPEGTVPGAVIGGGLGLLGEYLPLAVQSYGSQRERQDKAGIDDPGAAIAGAAAVTGLNMLGPAGRVAGKLATGTLKKGAMTLGQKVATEALTQAAVGGGSAAAEDYGSTGQVTEGDTNDILMGAVKGAATGAVIGGVHHVLGKAPPPPPAAEDQPPAPLALPAPQQALPAPTGESPTQGPIPGQLALPAPTPPGLPAPADSSTVYAGAPGAQLQLASPTDTIDRASQMVQGYEGFSDKAYWDVNHWRVGYGSDTVTDENGNVRPTKQGDVVDKPGANRDLQRRLNMQFTPSVRKAVGPKWDSLNSDTQAALLSVAYNYGHLPASVASAVRSGDTNKIASSVEQLSANPERRTTEAQIIRGGGIQGFAGQPGTPGEAVNAGVDVSSVTPQALLRQIEDIAGTTDVQQAPVLAKALAQASATNGESAATAIANERASLAAAHDALTQSAPGMSEENARFEEQRLAQREDVLEAATKIANRLAEARGPNIVTDMGPLREAPAEPNPGLDALNQQLAQHQANNLSARTQMEQAQAAAQAEAAKQQSPEALAHRAKMVQDIVKNDAITDPVGEFQQAMQAVGLSPNLSPAEQFALGGRQHFLEREAARRTRAEQAAGGMHVPTPEEVAQRRTQGLESQRAQPEQAAPAEAPPAEAAPAEAPMPAEVPAPAAAPAPTEAAAPAARALTAKDQIRQQLAEEQSARGQPKAEGWHAEGVKAGLDLRHKEPVSKKGSFRANFEQGKKDAAEELARHERAQALTPEAPAERPMTRAAAAEAARREAAAAEKAAADKAAAEKAAAEKEAKPAPKPAPKAAEKAKAASKAKAELKPEPKPEPKAAEKAKAASKEKATAKALEKAAKPVEPTERTKEAAAAKKPVEAAPEAKAKITKERLVEAKEKLAQRGKVERVNTQTNPEVDETTESQQDKDRRDLMARIREARDNGLLPSNMAADLVRGATETDTNDNYKLSNDALEAKVNGLLGPAEVKGGKQRLGGEPAPEAADVKKHWTNVRDSLRRELDRLGLKDVDLKVFDKLADNARGSYVSPDLNPGMRHLIQIALNHADRMGTLGHEVIHALREMNLFKPGEWEAMAKQARSDPELVSRIDKDYAHLNDAGREEEMVAEMYRNWAHGEVPETGPVSAIMSKIRAIFGAIGRAFRGNPSPTGTEVMKRIMSGEVGSRSRGQTRGDLGVREAGLRQRVASKDDERDLPPRMKTPAARIKRNAVQQAGENLRVSAADLLKKGSFLLSSTHDIAATAAKLHQMPSAAKMVDLYSRSFARSRETIESVLKQKDDYHDLPAKYRGTMPGSVSEFLYDSNVAGKWGFKPDWAPNAVLDPELVKRYNAMKADGSGGAKAAKVISDVFQKNYELRNELRGAMTGAINTEYEPQIAAAKSDAERADLQQQQKRAQAYANRIFDTADDKPYSPMKRQGRFAIVAKSAAFRAAEKAQDWDAVDRMVDDDRHHYVDFRDSVHEAKQMAEDMGEHFNGKNDYVSYFERGSDEENNAFEHGDLFLPLKKMAEAIAANRTLSEKAKKEMTRVARDIYLHSVSENSALKAELGRKGVPAKNLKTGEVPDMMKAHVSRAMATANYVSSLANSGEMRQHLEGMKQELHDMGGDARTQAQLYHNEIMYRYMATQGRPPARVVDRIVRGTSLYTVLSQPFYYVQNSAQNVQFAQPLLAAKFGYFKSAGEFNKAYGDFFKMTHGMNPLQDRVSFDNVPPDIAQAVHQLLIDGHLDAGFAAESGAWEMSGEGVLPTTFNRADRFTRRFPQFVEIMNRTTSGIAAYRLAIADGQTHDQAVATAKQLIVDAHGDYSGFNAPGAFHRLGNASKIILQFKKFQMNEGAMLLREFRKTFQGATPEEKLEGVKSLAFISAHALALSGITGLPAAGLAGWAMGYLLNTLDPDRKKREWTDWHHSLRETLGAGKEGAKKDFLSDFLYKGAPYALGLDLSDKLGMGNVAALMPQGSEKAFDSPDEWYQTVGKVLGGATGGIVSRAVGALDYGISTGDWEKMIEGFAPSVVSNTAKAIRLNQQGMQARGGERLMAPGKFGLGQSLLLASGITPSMLSTQSEKTNEVYDATKYYQSIDDQMKNRWVRASQDGDVKTMGALRQDWIAIQQAKRRDGFLPTPMTEMIQARREAMRRQAHTLGGVEFGRANRRFVMDGEDAFAADPTNQPTEATP